MPTLEEALFVHRQALALRSQRQEILASNIANADTPNYKARDFDFQSAMASALDQRGLPLNTTATQHIPKLVKGSTNPALLFRNEYQSAVDGNTVEMDHERTQMTENSVQYQVLVTLISDEFSGMRAALAPTQG